MGNILRREGVPLPAFSAEGPSQCPRVLLPGSAARAATELVAA